MTSNASTAPAPARKRRLLLPGLVAFVVFCALMTLGTWQVMRLQWKLALIERVEERIDLPPVDPPAPEAWAGIDEDAWDYRPVRLTGRFLEGEVYYYIALSEPHGTFGGPGYLVYAPFRTEAGPVVMVNRGFVPEARRLPESRPGSEPPEAEVEITGLWRRDERGNMFTLDADPKTQVWFVREAPKMAASLGIDDAPLAPFSVDLRTEATPAGGLPQAGETIISFRNNHLQYAVTWYGLGLVLIGVFIAFARSETRRPSGE
ncbi:SURF1 family protein [Stappia indica]|uniref:SURF1 family protein n=1 Tax=Stappia indica TaxID=538381 RepID=UPI001D1801E5|nr:SURF1 family protein [Stappia indica]MCC4244091.1 SURF1 family protein [Stappia indica]